MWSRVCLGRVATINMGQSPPSGTVTEDGNGLPFVQGNAEFGPRNPLPVKFCSKPQKQARPGDILLSVRAPVGALNLAIETLCIGRGLSAITPTRVHAEFLWHALHREVSDLTRVSQGSTFSAVNKADLFRLGIALPPLKEQRKIAAVLSSVDDAIEKTQAVIDQVQVVKRGLMQQLLTRGLLGRHTRFKQTEIGEIPVCWQLAVLDDVLEGIDAGWSPKCEGRPAELGEWGVLKVSSISTGLFNQHENKALNGELKARTQFEVRRGDVLLARASGVLDLVGRSAFVHWTRPKLMLSDKTLRLRAKKSVMRSMFLNLLLEDPRVHRQVLMRATGSHMRNISQRALRRVPIPVPSLKEQEHIEVLNVHTGTRLEQERNFLRQLEIAKSALMSVLLTGELRVTPDAEAS